MYSSAYRVNFDRPEYLTVRTFGVLESFVLQRTMYCRSTVLRVALGHFGGAPVIVWRTTGTLSMSRIFVY